VAARGADLAVFVFGLGVSEPTVMNVFSAKPDDIFSALSRNTETSPTRFKDFWRK
jgi:hypothetical protein